MIISEKDLFKYVFHRDSLSDSIIELIEQNKMSYAKELSLLNEISASLGKNLNDSTLIKILNKIDEINNISPFLEESVINKIETGNGKTKSYSTPTVLVKELKSETFKDFNSNYIIKLITQGDKRKIYAFSNKFTAKDKIKLTLEPIGESYEIEVNKEPLTIKSTAEINNIYLTTID